jgi:hypothetical protein
MWETVGTGAEDVKSMLVDIKKKCDRLGCSYPIVFNVDDAPAMEKTIKSIFPDARVTQDIKHLVNRMVEKLSKMRPLYGQMCIDLHQAITGSQEVSVIDRTGKARRVRAPLPSRETMKENLNRVVNNYKRLDSELFLKDFDKVMNTQIKNIDKGYVDEIYLNEEHYLELGDGKFVLLRGTNRNESLHRRLNKIWKDRVGRQLSEALKLVFRFNWNCSKLRSPCSFAFHKKHTLKGVDTHAGTDTYADTHVRTVTSAETTGGVSTDTLTGTDTYADTHVRTVTSAETTGGVSTGTLTGTDTYADTHVQTLTGSEQTTIDSAITASDSYMTAFTKLLIHLRVPVSLTTIGHVETILRERLASGLPNKNVFFIRTAAHDMALAPLARTGIVRQYDALKNNNIHGSHRSSYSRVPPNRCRGTKRPRDDEQLTEPPQKCPTFIRWQPQHVQLLKDIMKTTKKDHKGWYNWEEIHSNFSALGNIIISRDQLKSKWQSIHTCAATNREDDVIFPLPLEAPADTNASSNEVTISEAIENDSGDGEATVLTSVTQPIPTEEDNHPGYTYDPTIFKMLTTQSSRSIADIESVSLPTAPRKTQFSDAEQAIFHYILKKRLPASSRISWVLFETQWMFCAKRVLLESQHKVKVFIRNKEHLRDRARTLNIK